LHIQRNVIDRSDQRRAVVGLAEDFADVAEGQDGHEFVSARPVKGGLK
jgi:hypothetical protein